MPEQGPKDDLTPYEDDLVRLVARRLHDYEVEFGEPVDFDELDDTSMARLLAYVEDLEPDSLVLLEALETMFEGDWGEEGDEGGTSFVREPRNPNPYSGAGAIALSMPLDPSLQ